jgi:hypothetical protein
MLSKQLTSSPARSCDALSWVCRSSDDNRKHARRIADASVHRAVLDHERDREAGLGHLQHGRNRVLSGAGGRGDDRRVCALQPHAVAHTGARHACRARRQWRMRADAVVLRHRQPAPGHCGDVELHVVDLDDDVPAWRRRLAGLGARGSTTGVHRAAGICRRGAGVAADDRAQPAVARAGRIVVGHAGGTRVPASDGAGSRRRTGTASRVSLLAVHGGRRRRRGRVRRVARPHPGRRTLAHCHGCAGHVMYKRILVPTDGSEITAKAVDRRPWRWPSCHRARPR